MGHTIIIIDDDDTLEAVVGQVAPADVDVQRYPDAKHGLRAAYRNPPDLIILSADMPEGYASCRRLKRERTLRDIGLILVSGEATTKDFAQHARLKTRANLYIHKPVDGAILAKGIVDLLGRETDEAEPPPLPEATAPPAPPPEVSAHPPAPPEISTVDEPSASPAEASTTTTTDVDTILRERDSLRIEISKLTERLHNVKQAHRRAEDGFERELATLRQQLAAARAGDMDGADSGSELRRVTHLYNDLLESMDVIVESLRIPLELVERHQELTEQASLEPAEEPILEDDMGDSDAIVEPAVDELDEGSSMGFDHG